MFFELLNQIENEKDLDNILKYNDDVKSILLDIIQANSNK